MKQVILKIEGMSCSACSNGLEKYLRKQKGIVEANVNLVLAQALIKYEDNLTLTDLDRFVSEAGFESAGVYNPAKEDKKMSKTPLIIFSFLAIFILYFSMGHMIGLPSLPYFSEKYPLNYAIGLLIITIPFLIYGWDLFKNGYKNLIHKSPNMDTLVSLGVIASFGYSIFSLVMITKGNHEYVHHLYFESCAMIIYFIKLGRFIDHGSREKTKEALKELVSITPSTALIKKGDDEIEVTIDEVKIGDILICKPGMKMAVDGEIISGSCHVDESFITGESKPVKKEFGSKVVAGSINFDGYILYKALKIGKDSTISEIVHLVSEATNTKAPISRLADKISGYFVPTIMLVSLLTLLGYLLSGAYFNEALMTSVTVLVVACPCALGLATPMAMVVSLGVCAKNGILVKSSATLEMASHIDTIVFDKTGTLTYGNLKVTDIFNYSDKEELMKLVCSLESASDHPISRAFKEYQENNKLVLYNVIDFESINGIGLKAKIDGNDIYVGGNKLFSYLDISNIHLKDEDELTKKGCSLIYVIKEKEVLGLIGVCDAIRADAKMTIQRLKRLGKDVIMLTGDNDKTAKVIADTLEIENVIANVLPKDKTKVIKELMQNNHKVCMVGDGVNDAPALATATLGISIVGGTDIASSSADVVLMRDELSKIPSLMDISHKTIVNIKENLFWAFFYNIIMIPLAIGLFAPLGLKMNPMFGGLAMTISSLTVVFNALRLKRWRDNNERYD